MYERQIVNNARILVAQGLSISEISRRTGANRSTIRSWVSGSPPSEKPQCPASRPELLDKANYAYLLGLYLGDGSISKHPRGVHRLRIACADVYPDLIKLCVQAMELALPNKVGIVQTIGCVHVNSYSKHWPCLFPQHGKGPKHLRKIELVDWQLKIVREYPWELIRGLIHSDGCRDLNPVNGKNYVRYSFCNMSQDIKDIFTDALDHVGVHWTKASSRIISIARRPSVALMEEHIGPKS